MKGTPTQLTCRGALHGYPKIFAFTYRSGKGSHTVWSHQHLDYSIILSGRDSADAQRYQEKDVRNALRDLAKLEEGDSQ